MHSWAIKTTTQLEKPRYVIFALQTARRNVPTENASQFDDCAISNIKLYLNSEFYPYDDMNLDFDNKKYVILYEMYSKFRKSYYGCEFEEMYLPIDKFITTDKFIRSVRSDRLFSSK